MIMLIHSHLVQVFVQGRLDWNLLLRLILLSVLTITKRNADSHSSPDQGHQVVQSLSLYPSHLNVVI